MRHASPLVALLAERWGNANLRDMTLHDPLNAIVWLIIFNHNVTMMSLKSQTTQKLSSPMIKRVLNDQELAELLDAKVWIFRMMECETPTCLISHARI